MTEFRPMRQILRDGGRWAKRRWWFIAAVCAATFTFVAKPHDVGDDFLAIVAAVAILAFAALGEVTSEYLRECAGELQKCQMDSANYRAECDTCGTRCMDMLTDDHCAVCQSHNPGAEIP
jgi:hypothetical protein